MSKKKLFIVVTITPKGKVKHELTWAFDATRAACDMSHKVLRVHDPETLRDLAQSPF